MNVNDDGTLDDLTPEQLLVKSFFENNFYNNTNPNNNRYLSSRDITIALLNVFPNSAITENMVTNWLEGKFRRIEIGGGSSIKILWAVSKRLF